MEKREAKRANVGGSMSDIFLIFLSRESNIFQSWNILLKITLFRHATIKILLIKYNFSVLLSVFHEREEVNNEKKRLQDQETRDVEWIAVRWDHSILQTPIFLEAQLRTLASVARIQQAVAFTGSFTSKARNVTNPALFNFVVVVCLWGLF